MAGIFWRAMVILHRYLGIAIGLLMAMWFVSSIVMMYVPYSRVQAVDHLPIQLPVPWASCCNYGALADDTRVTRAQVVDHLGTPHCGCARRAGRTFCSISPASPPFSKTISIALHRPLRVPRPGGATTALNVDAVGWVGVGSHPFPHFSHPVQQYLKCC